ncbi:MAG TPA: LD-carboxypeptidase [Desulfurivibrio alkaliphilus]|uniref:LD-carboxypeptidase n=1 Tax=Desulfurivibrio alkaliphilus TaxID=427923 RepID=A0A7C2X915_9BACT|nr:LD-carboxypeptidase [Desulfurivibrio alkaliphilus]
MNVTIERRVLPPPLKRGDTIGIFAPAGPVNDGGQNAAAGLGLLREAGFKLRLQTGLIDRRRGYLAGDDQERVAELHDLWRDPEVKALLALRGGYGCLRLLNLLDWELLGGQRKLLIGFSDLTIFHTAFQRRTDLITLHGPMLNTLVTSDRETMRNFFQTLSGNWSPITRPAGLEILRFGQARGPLIGGNLTCLSHLPGSGWEPLLDGAILLLEDVGEAPYRLDRALTHLALAGWLERVAAIILGEFADCGAVEEVWQRTLELTAGSNIPIWANFPAGHGRRNLPLPLGAMATLDSRGRTLSWDR